MYVFALSQLKIVGNLREEAIDNYGYKEVELEKNGYNRRRQGELENFVKLFNGREYLIRKRNLSTSIG